MLPRLIRFGLLSALALTLLPLAPTEAPAQDRRIRAHRAAVDARREARRAEKLARERARQARQEELQRQMDERAARVEDDESEQPALDPFDDFEDPLDEIDDFDEEDELDADLAIDDAELTDPTDAAAGLDLREHDEPSLALDIYRSTERSIGENDDTRPYDLRDDAPGLERADPFGSDPGGITDPAGYDDYDAGLDTDF